MVRIAIAPMKLFAVLLVAVAVTTFAYAIVEPAVLEVVTSYLRDHVVPWAARR